MIEENERYALALRKARQYIDAGDSRAAVNAIHEAFNPPEFDPTAAGVNGAPK